MVRFNVIMIIKKKLMFSLEAINLSTSWYLCQATEGYHYWLRYLIKLLVWLNIQIKRIKIKRILATALNLYLKLVRHALWLWVVQGILIDGLWISRRLGASNIRLRRACMWDREYEMDIKDIIHQTKDKIMGTGKSMGNFENESNYMI